MKSLEVIDAEELFVRPFRPPIFVVEGLISQGVTMVNGSGKIGKSWLMLWLGLRVSQGLPLWDYPTRRCEVLYLCLEDTLSRIQSRLYRLTDNAPPQLRFAVYCNTLGRGLEEQIQEYLRIYPGTKLIIIDTLQKVRDSQAVSKAGMYANDYDDISMIKRLADQNGLAIVLVHHTRKHEDSDDPFKNVSGTAAITGAADTSLVLRKNNRASDTALLVATGRDIPYQELQLRMEDCVWQLVERKDQETLRRESIPPFLFRLTDFLMDNGSWEGTATELLRAMGETEIKPNGVVKCITRYFYEFLRPKGIYYQTRRTGQSRLIRLTYRDANDDDDGENDIGEYPGNDTGGEAPNMDK